MSGFTATGKKEERKTGPPNWGCRDGSAKQYANSRSRLRIDGIRIERRISDD
jgi:hypothetical protein